MHFPHAIYDEEKVRPLSRSRAKSRFALSLIGMNGTRS
jgi:hypothetical protein